MQRQGTNKHGFKEGIEPNGLQFRFENSREQRRKGERYTYIPNNIVVQGKMAMELWAKQQKVKPKGQRIRVTHQNMTVEEMFDFFLKDLRGSGTAHVHNVELAIKGPWMEDLLPMKARDVELEDLEAVKDWMWDAYEEETYAGSTLSKYWRYITRGFDEGIRRRAFDYNLCHSITKLPPAKRIKYFRMLMDAEFPIYLSALRDKHRCLGGTMLLAGLRLSEAMALEVSDVTFDKQTQMGKIRVNKQLHRKGRNYGTVPVKTEAGNRPVDCGPELWELFQFQAKQNGLAGRIGGSYFADLIVGSGVRSALDTVARRLNREQPKGWTIPEDQPEDGSHGLHPHALRHNFASQLLYRMYRDPESKLDLPKIAEQLGHAHANVTTTTYAHVIKDAERNDGRAGRAISSIFQKVVV